MISIIIPVLNEAEGIGELLYHINSNGSASNIQEIIIVDGGSVDSTHLVVAQTSTELSIPIRFINSEKGRAVQMNNGAAQASGDVLYFLHADSFPPKHFDHQIMRVIDQGKVAGCFRMKFDSKHPVLRISQWFTRFNVKYCRGGDQSLFVTNKVFEALNGYNKEYGIYEDCEFINRLYDQFDFTVLNDYIITSARKYNSNGTWKLQYHFTVIHLKKLLGASPSKLQSYYDQNIAS